MASRKPAHYFFPFTVQQWHQLRKISIAIKKSPTKLQPKWTKILADLGLKKRKIPRDVATRWNSTYDMLAFAVEYKKAIKTLVQDIDSKLTACQLSKQEWGFVSELTTALNVRDFLYQLP